MNEATMAKRISKLFSVLVLSIFILSMTITAFGAVRKDPRYSQDSGKDFNTDAPWRVQNADTPIPFVFAIHDVYMNALDELNKLEIFTTNPDTTNPTLIYSHDFDIPIDKNTKGSVNGNWEFNVETFENAKDSNLNEKQITARNLGFIEGNTIYFKTNINIRGGDFCKYLKVVVGEPLPKPLKNHYVGAILLHVADDNWYYGDTHYHTEYTNNDYEYGGTLLSTKNAIGAMGLDWVTTTDHASNVENNYYWFKKWDLSQDAFANLKARVNLLNINGLPFLVGEEVTCKASEDGVLGRDQLHLLVYNNSKFISGEISGSRMQPTYTLQDRLAQVTGDAFAFAAHPTYPEDTLWGNNFIADMVEWSYDNYATGIASSGFSGLEIWNGRDAYQKKGIGLLHTVNPFNTDGKWAESNTDWDQKLKNGITKWDELLSNQLFNKFGSPSPLRKIFIEGGSDAHGDFNYFTYTDIEYITLLSANDNALGKVRTLVYAPESKNATNILNGLKNGHSVITDGPVCIFGIDKNGDGDLTKDDTIIGDDVDLTSGQSLKFLIKWQSTKEFGPVENWKIYRGSAESAKPIETILDMTAITGEDRKSGSITWEEKMSTIKNGMTYYYRMEVRSHTSSEEYRCLTNPIWVSWDNNSNNKNHLYLLPLKNIQATVSQEECSFGAGCTNKPNNGTLLNNYGNKKYNSNIIHIDKNREGTVRSSTETILVEPSLPANRAETLLLAMLVNGNTFEQNLPSHYSDVPTTYELYDVIETATKLGIVQGYDGVNSGTFAPENTVTRAEALKIIFKTFGLDLLETSNKGPRGRVWSDSLFYDLDSTHWSYKYARAAYLYEIMDGFGDGRFAPNSEITRSQLVKIVHQAMQLSNQNFITAGHFIEPEEEDYSENNNPPTGKVTVTKQSNGNYKLKAECSDPEGKKLSYYWIAQSGSFANISPDETEVEWIPSAGGIAPPIELWVTDGYGLMTQIESETGATPVVFPNPIPDTGITKCYNHTAAEIPCPKEGEDFYGQDANYSINPMSYTKLDATGKDLPVTATTWAMVKDNVTGLIWENNSHSSTWNDAPIVIASLNTAKFGGYSDWRLPTMTELGSIVDFSIPYTGPTINTNYFKDTFASFYWSSSPNANYMDGAWGVYFSYGRDDIDGKDYANYVRAVRAGQSIIRSFDPLVINGDRIVSDNTTGLMWQQDTAKTATGATTMVWKDALSYCENLILGGYTDWRLPTVKELRSIVDYTVYSPAIDTSVFKDTFASFYWSSSTDVYYMDGAWGVPFSYRYGSGYYKTSAYYVRAVRAGQLVIGSFGHLTISSTNKSVSNSAGSATFSVSNTDTAASTMAWSASVTSGGDWLSITSGSNGSNSGTITCSYSANTTTSARTGTIRVTANGATGSPQDLIVVQASGGSKPTVQTGTAGAVATNSATLNGTINPNGTPTTYYFQYGTTTSYGKVTPAGDAGLGTTIKSVSANITGLTANTLYHVQLVGKNTAGTVYGGDKTFTTTASSITKPVVTTGSASLITENSAKLSGTVTPKGASTTYYFEYGATTAYGKKTAILNAGSGTASVSVNANLVGFSAGTTYYFKLVATNSAGTAYGVNKTFTTTKLATVLKPTVTTEAATSITATLAKLNGTVNPNGDITSYYFQYGLTTSYGSTTRSPRSGSERASFSVYNTITGLTKNTTYHFRIVAINSAGTTYGLDKTFTTLP